MALDKLKIFSWKAIWLIAWVHLPHLFHLLIYPAPPPALGPPASPPASSAGSDAPPPYPFSSSSADSTPLRTPYYFTTWLWLSGHNCVGLIDICPFQHPLPFVVHNFCLFQCWPKMIRTSTIAHRSRQISQNPTYLLLSARKAREATNSDTGSEKKCNKKHTHHMSMWSEISNS